MGSNLKSLVDTALDHEGPPHLKVFGLHGPNGAAAFEAEGLEEARQRHRLWVCPATCARDLLLLPRFWAGIPGGSWMAHVGLQHDTLGSFDPARLRPPHLHRTEDESNVQDAARLKTEGS